MIDHSIAGLARRARQLLADARNATLLVDGIGRLPDADAVVLHDQDGRPRFFCPAESSLTAAASTGCPAVLSVVSEPTSSSVRVVFVGHLAVVGTEQIEAERVDIVELRLTSVIVEQDDPGSPTVTTHQVPLAHYLRSTVDPLVAAAERIRRHTNGRHGDRLRAFVATHTRVGTGAIAHAHIAALDPTDAVIAWIDLDGTHEARLRFTATAADPAELAALLRAELDRPRGMPVAERPAEGQR